MSATKVTSVCSTSGAPTPPNATPRTEGTGNSVSPPHMDFDAVGRILGTAQEDLNESADAAMYPSPPINTPETFSPAPSVYKVGRGRGLSIIGDRLAQLKLEERSSPRKDTDLVSSNRSVAASTGEGGDEKDDDDVSSTGKYAATHPYIKFATSQKLFSIPGMSIPIALGSPAFNPRVEEYLNFSSSDLPVSKADKHTSSLTNIAADKDGEHKRGHSIKSSKSEGAVSGVTEKSNWAEEVEEAAGRAVKQLEQLADDEFQRDPSKSIEDYYVARLQKLLASARFPVSVSKKAKSAE